MKNKMKIPKKTRQHLYTYITAFSIPMLTLLTVYCFLGIHPFGDKSLLTSDLNGQYISFLSYFRHVVLEDGSLFYTFSKNLGGDMIGLGAYYLLSPLNFILLFFKTESLPTAVMVLTLIKTGLCGLTMNIFLNREALRRSSLLFSTSYALMAYMMVYQPHIMWLDGVIVLPLIVYGIEKIIKKQSPFLYILSLGAAIISNYYIGFMLCLFSLVYFFCSLLFFQNQITVSWKNKEIFRSIHRFGGYSLLAGGLSAFILLPTLQALRGGKASFALFPHTVETNFALMDFFSKFYIGNESQELPNIYCGMLIILFCVIFFLNKKISRKEKIGSGILLSVLIVSFTINICDAIWHGFNSPFGFPYRYSFIFSFLLILIAYKGYQKSKPILTPKVSVSIFAIVLGFSMIVEKYQYPHTSSAKIYISVFIFLLILTTFFLYAKRPLKIYIVAALCLCLMDLGVNSYLTLRSVEYTPYDNYYTYTQKNKAIHDQLKEMDSTFYRVEQTYRYNFNDPMLFNYHGLTHFSSTEKQFVKAFMEKMGFRTYVDYWSYYNQGSTISVDSLFGIKYLLTTDQIKKPYELLWRQDDVLVYKNPYALPLAFMVREDVLQVTLSEKDPFALQNSIWNAMAHTPEEVVEQAPEQAPEQAVEQAPENTPEEALFYPAEIKTIAFTNLREEDYEDGVCYRKQDATQEAFIEYSINNISADPLYAFFPAHEIRDVEIFINDTSTGDDNSLGSYFNTYNHNILDLGKRTVSDTPITLRIKLNEDEVFMEGALFYYQNMRVFNEYYEEVSSSPYMINSYTGAYLEGEVTNQSDKTYLLFTIPYEENWHFHVDGNRTPAIKVFDTLMAVEIPQGTVQGAPQGAPQGVHSVTLKYVPKHLYLGIAVTLLSGGILLLCVGFSLRRKRRLAGIKTPLHAPEHMTDAERAKRFPIILSKYNPAWPQWYDEEKERLLELISDDAIVRINHIGSTSVPGLTAKPTVDILLEIAVDTNIEKLIASLPSDEYICIRKPTVPDPDNKPPHIMFLKGYTSQGFAEKVYHIHVRYPGDWDEVHFRDYLTLHPEAAAKYAELKVKLKGRFEHDRDGYTNAKGEFIKAVTKQARDVLGTGNTLEKMDDFFSARIDIYDAHMLQNIEGIAEGHKELAKRIPAEAQTLLDLGCGTGLELEEIFWLHPDVCVTGIDLTQAMLDKLAEKYSDKNVIRVCASYLGYDFGSEKYDCVISFQTMHHLTHEEKTGLYINIRKALKPGGKYIECDYMVDTQEEEDHGVAESKRLRAEQNISDGEFYHLDTPCTVDNQIKLFVQAGFVGVEKIWHKGAATMIIAEKEL